MVIERFAGKQVVEDICDKIARLDAYPKAIPEYKIKTVGGASVTIVSLGLILLLCFIELKYFLTTETHQELLIDVSHGQKLTINFDILFPHVPCNQLTLDSTDISGEQHVNIQHDIFKHRIDKDGQPISSPLKDNSIAAKKIKPSIVEVTTNSTAPAKDACGSCYGAETPVKKCCHTCQEVFDAYNARGWARPAPSTVEQCRREGYEDTRKSDEGCRINGTLQVNKVAGNFHITLGQSIEEHHVHGHYVNLADIIGMNNSHQIKHFSFGKPVASLHAVGQQTNQLDATWFIDESLATFHYYTKIVPLIYQSLDGEEIYTYQFAVNRYKKGFGSLGGGGGTLGGASMPGIFFVYEFAPMLVKYSETTRSLAEFLTNMCAIVGGLLTVSGIIDSFVYHSLRLIREKIRLNKLS